MSRSLWLLGPAWEVPRPRCCWRREPRRRWPGLHCGWGSPHLLRLPGWGSSPPTPLSLASHGIWLTKPPSSTHHGAHGQDEDPVLPWRKPRLREGRGLGGWVPPANLGPVRGAGACTLHRGMKNPGLWVWCPSPVLQCAHACTHTRTPAHWRGMHKGEHQHPNQCPQAPCIAHLQVPTPPVCVPRPMCIPTQMLVHVNTQAECAQSESTPQKETDSGRHTHPTQPPGVSKSSLSPVVSARGTPARGPLKLGQGALEV